MVSLPESSESQLSDRFNKVPSVILSSKAVGMEIVQIVFRTMRYQAESVQYCDVFISSRGLLYVFTKADKGGKLLWMIPAPDG